MDVHDLGGLEVTQQLQPPTRSTQIELEPKLGILLQIPKALRSWKGDHPVSCRSSTAFQTTTHAQFTMNTIQLTHPHFQTLPLYRRHMFRKRCEKRTSRPVLQTETSLEAFCLLPSSSTWVGDADLGFLVRALSFRRKDSA